MFPTRVTSTRTRSTASIVTQRLSATTKARPILPGNELPIGSTNTWPANFDNLRHAHYCRRGIVDVMWTFARHGGDHHGFARVRPEVRPRTSRTAWNRGGSPRPDHQHAKRLTQRPTRVGRQLQYNKRITAWRSAGS